MSAANDTIAGLRKQAASLAAQRNALLIENADLLAALRDLTLACAGSANDREVVLVRARAAIAQATKE